MRLHGDVQPSLGYIEAGVQSVATASLSVGTVLVMVGMMVVVERVLTVVLWLVRSVIIGSG